MHLNLNLAKRVYKSSKLKQIEFLILIKLIIKKYLQKLFYSLQFLISFFLFLNIKSFYCSFWIN